MTPLHLRKRISRALRVTWRDELTRHDVAALQDNIKRVGLVIRLRWALVAVLAIYSVFGVAAYSTRIAVPELAGLMLVPAGALAFVVIYNTFFQLTYRRLGNLAVFNTVQLALDALVVVVLVYYSGGVASWFWSILALFILESAFIMQAPRETWGLAVYSSLLLGIVVAAEYFGILPHQEIPFGDSVSASDGVYVLVRYLWQVTVLAGTASVAIIGVRALTADRDDTETLIDTATNLYSRSFFRRALAAETGRARREKRPVHVILIDIDRFGEFNRRFGIELGEEMLCEAAKAVRSTLARVGDIDTSTNVAARWGGEEFAIMLVEDVSTDSVPDIDTARRVAEELRRAIGDVRVRDAGITVSVGLATFPVDGMTAEELIDVADEALAEAHEAGGNRVQRGVGERAAAAGA